MQENEQITKEMWNAVMEKTRIPCIKLTLTDSNPSIFESKVGGLGYVPHGEQIPTDSKGFQLRLLAQIDCSQITLSDFPHTGLLQFWILNDDLCGCDFDNNTHQDGFRICYYPEIDLTVTEEEVAAKEENNLPFGEDLFPVTGCYGLQFQETQDMISPNDYRFHEWIMEATRQLYPEQAERLLADESAFFEKWDAYLEQKTEAEDESTCPAGFGHKIGGYPGFTQWDPRDGAKKDYHDGLLFQLDSDFGGKERIMWGDAGICNFFINQEKLKQCDFSDVIYNWDCY